MKNKILIFFIIFFLTSIVKAENIVIESKKISINKKMQLSIFEKDVVITTPEKQIIKSDYAEYDKKKGIIILKNNIKATDAELNEVVANYAEYNENLKTLITTGKTTVNTSENYTLESNNILFDDLNKIIKSEELTTITDQNNNKIYLSNFEYLTNKYIFKSVGEIKVIDNIRNSYNFSQVYIDTKKKELLGTDIKSYLNSNNFKIDERNKPRIFANSVKIQNEISEFNKANFTLCDYRKNNKCPPWTIQSTKMLHDNKKKTIYYDNALIKVYDIPVFYSPKFSHPDPSVKRRSGFLVPSFHDTKNLGEGITIPYFWAINKDKDLTISHKLYASENPLFLGEYRHAFRNSNLFFDFGFTEGYKKTSSVKQKGQKTHFFSKYVKNFSNTVDNSESTLSITTQDSTNDKYFKLYKINSELVNEGIDTLKNTINFTHSDDEFFFGFDMSVYETLKNGYNDKYEYIYPDLTFDKNLLTNSSIGSINYDANLKIHTYDTNKTSKIFVNNFNWNSVEKRFNTGIQTSLLGNLKNINYEVKNINKFKPDNTNELFGSIGFLSKINFFKKVDDFSEHFLTPKILLRYAPGEMRKQETSKKLSPSNAFNLNRISSDDNYETGLSTTLGFDYEIKKKDKNLNFSLSQIINKEENKKMPTTMGLDEKLSDLVGTSKYSISDKFNLNYNFALDQNYSEFNYNEIAASTKFDTLNFNVNYLQEKKHIGNNEYIKSKIDYNINNETNLAYEFKRNLITNSSEFYNLSYEYFNDCLKAGLVFRREFYNDSEIEAENSLMFRITLTSFGALDSPKFNQ